MKKEEEENKNIVERPPIVVVMGHVDHGKTKLLDYIRNTNIIAGEAGGITQHIGAYEIEHGGKKITFIDTPGHESFSQMRSRGANVADIALLVVSAEEGVKPQTLESLEKIKEEKMPFMVVVNKIDKAESNPARVRQQLAEKGVISEEWGGVVPFCEVSAKTGEKIDELLDLIVLMAEMEGLNGDVSEAGQGVIIESHCDPRIGMVAVLLIRNGSMKIGNYIVVGNACGKIKNLQDFRGKNIDFATFSSPVKVTGFSSLPSLGEEFRIFVDKKEAEQFAGAHICAEDESVKCEICAEKKILNIILKTDVKGSIEAIEKTINEKMKFKEAEVNIVFSGVGDITETDLKLAQSSKSIIAMFNTKRPQNIQILMQTMDIKFISTNIIYELFDMLKDEMKKIIDASVEKVDLGKLEILGVFKTGKDKVIIGGKVVSDKISKGAKADIFRGDQHLFSGKISQLQHNKADVNEVSKGKECGLMISGIKTQNETDVKVGDHLLAYEERALEKELTI